MLGGKQATKPSIEVNVVLHPIVLCDPLTDSSPAGMTSESGRTKVISPASKRTRFGVNE